MPDSFKVWFTKYNGNEPELQELSKEFKHLRGLVVLEGESALPSANEGDFAPLLARLSDGRFPSEDVKDLIRAWQLYCKTENIEDKTDWKALEARESN